MPGTSVAPEQSTTSASWSGSASPGPIETIRSSSTSRLMSLTSSGPVPSASAAPRYSVRVTGSAWHGEPAAAVLGCQPAADPDRRAVGIVGRLCCPGAVNEAGVTEVAVTEDIVPSGPYRLRESAEFGFGQRHAQRFDGVLRMAFALDGTFAPVAVAVRQAVDDGPVVVEVARSADRERVVAQTARVLSLDHDAAGYPRGGGRDPVVGGLMAIRPGLRPPLFHSPYEAAAWSVLSARRPALQMAAALDPLA